MLPEDIADVLQWIEGRRSSARAECERLLALHQARPASDGTIPGVKLSMRLAADVAAATARLETWNEIRADLVKSFSSAGPIR